MSARGSSQNSDIDECVFIPSKKAKVDVLPLDLWTDDHRFTLINEVMVVPALWDIRLPSYKLKQNDFLWPKIAEAVNAAHGTVFTASAKKQWRNLRDTFVKKNRALQTMQNGSSTDQLPVRWKFFNAMQFLLETMDVGKRLSNIGASVSECAGPSSSAQHLADKERSTSVESSLSAHPLSSADSPAVVLKEEEEETPVVRKKRFSLWRREVTSKEAALERICNAVEAASADDQFQAFGRTIATSLRALSQVDMVKAVGLMGQLYNLVTETQKRVYGRK
ncbi:hypothetical protein Q1695_012532 [Nippostrongylus brasiliensis]|nr:hypothetical protein Q1695_012532 [Nippostrongylus brasiliensis]